MSVEPDPLPDKRPLRELVTSVAEAAGRAGFPATVGGTDETPTLGVDCPICRASPNGHGPPVTVHLTPGLPVHATCGCEQQLIRAAVLAMVRRGGLYPQAAIIVNSRLLGDITAEALSSLDLANDPPAIYVRGAGLSRVRTDEEGQPFIERLGVDALRNDAARAGLYARMSAKSGPTPVAPPVDVVRAILALDGWPFPPLEAVAEAPMLRPDGTILDQAGYDSPTRTLYRPDANLRVPEVPAEPSGDDVAAAVGEIDTVIAEFPFADDADRANAFATMLTPIVRPAITGMVPLALFNGTRAGTGKNLLANIIALIATGRAVGVISVPQTEEEWRKLLTSTLDAGQTIIVLDEAHELRSTALASVLTTGAISDRRLGATEMIRARNLATWIACGNNIRLAGDLPRRCYEIRLNARTARPWKRAFRITDLDAHTRAHRGELLAALLTIARAWWAAGRPSAEVPTIGGFSEWSTTIGGILANAGVDGFLANADDLYETADVEATQWEGWLRAILSAFDDQPFTAGELLGATQSHATPRLADSLPDDLADKHARRTLSKATLGRALGAKADTYHGDDGIRITRAAVSGRSGVATWTVVADQPAPLVIPGTQSMQSTTGRVGDTAGAAEQQSTQSTCPPMTRDAPGHTHAQVGEKSSAPSAALHDSDREAA